MDLSWPSIYIMVEWVIRILMLIYVPQQRSPNSARAWLLLIFFLPIPGVILYAWLGRIYVPHQRIQIHSEISQAIQMAQQHLAKVQPSMFASYQTEDPFLQNNMLAATAIGGLSVTDKNDVEILHGYELLISRLLDDINAAKQNIHMQYYIYGNDKIGQRVTDALCAAAKRGVKIRVLLDEIGASKGLKHQAPQMRAAGIDVHASFPVGLIGKNAARIDLRNHRKIAIFDGLVAHVGSQNVVDATFVPGKPNEELNLRITGPSVCQLQTVFMADYYSETHAPLETKELPDLFKIELFNRTQAGIAAQVVPSGPGYSGEVNRDVMITFIYSARKNIRIVTPYFVPDEPFQTALVMAAKRGVKVQLIFPKHSNQMLTNLVQESYFSQLMHAGVEIFLYRPGLLHAKFTVYDNEISIVGSSNIDVRSFALNAEISVVMYDKEITSKLYDIQEDYIAQSDSIELEKWNQRPRTKKIAANLARLADALL